ncbi:unnamed protein product [Clonostachys rosea]|uniref:Heterokaryon incompatibility domain-containing protein n=1 Tax=Bionectria ochroleuca TaxID=29856 RepID=A0ABY6UE19_BIOOC|nr:unnamed protein product [Clonostachys rosea]
MSSTEQPTVKADTHQGGHLLYPQPGDGNLIPLVIQSFQKSSLLPENVPWTRLGEPLSKVGTLEAIWYWVLSPILVKGSERVEYSPRSCFFLILRLLAAAPLCALMIPNALASIVARVRNIKSKSPEQIEAQCQYPKLPTPLLYSSSLSSRAREAPPLSNDPSLTSIQLGGQLALPRPDHAIVSNVSSSSSQFRSTGLSLGPRYLCFITDPARRQYSTMKVSDYNQQHGDQADTEFVFVSYTRLQFRVVTDAEIDEWKYPNEETREANRTLAHRDRETLIQWGIDAALAAGKRAFWLDFECVRDSDGVAKASSKSEDVYRICDIVRAAHSMIIAIGPPADEKVTNILNGDEKAPLSSAEHATKWLRQWGSRLWTLPELLLCPNEYRIKLYVVGDKNEPKSLAKRNFAERAWDDAESVKELVNHYEGSAILPPTQLISIALECFARRKTDQFSQGDIAYAVMGLFPDSQRPEPNQNDSGFRAFARLALAVEGSSLLSRLLCVAPAQPGAQWSDATDFWGVKLKDFRPSCDTVAVAGSNAVEVQNILATPICWDKIERATLEENLHLFPQIVFAILLFFPLFTWYRIVWLLLSAYENNQALQTIVPQFLIGMFFFQAILTPVSLPAFFLYEWKTRRKELRSARLVGVEGVLDCAAAERHIYGHHYRRLKEVPSTTTSDSETAIHRSGPTRPPRKFTFTLIDTCAQTLRVINCAAPPIAMMLCGEDAVGHRAILCSYNHETGVYHREETLRVEECVRQQMRLARSVNLSLQPFPLKLTEGPHDEDTINSSMNGQASRKSREWKPELVFYLMQWKEQIVHKSSNN